MKKLNKLTAILTAMILTVSGIPVSAETMPDTPEPQHTEEYYDHLSSIYSMTAAFIADNDLKARIDVYDDIIHIYLFDCQTSEEELSLIKEFIKETGIDASLVDIDANIVDPAVIEAADMINEFIKEKGLNAHAKIYENRTDTVFIDIQNWCEEKAVIRTIKDFMKDNDIDESLVDFIVWDTTDENGVLRGDMDGDGNITYVDLDLLKELVKKYPDNVLPDVADFNGDGNTDSSDAKAFEEYQHKMTSIYHDSTSLYECVQTRSCFSEISASDNNAVCKSLICGYDYVTMIVVNQTLLKENPNGKWKNVKTWKKTFKDYKASVKSDAGKLSKGYYRLKTTAVVYSGGNSETVTKYSRIYNAGISPDMGDANGDGKVNVRDCAYIAKMLAKGKGLPDKADYNLDGKKNVRDAAAIAKSLAEIMN